MALIFFAVCLMLLASFGFKGCTYLVYVQQNIKREIKITHRFVVLLLFSPCVGRKESDTHDKCLVKFGKSTGAAFLYPTTRSNTNCTR